ncbi:SURF1 family cytochrome oxidase biogenesis protein [Falsirhodobacter sp. alg1]|uniref:SURF1 family cytochrome oxidase biogenesis protein n=1 Tax=Falsirhodobacter sp. alg1 TaxID=1472418 RepID=UPI0007897C7B|nr:SURF1 family cytochrome oxidase biogenesis protein [Falsirhodobacter sp. alg1]
MKRLLVVLGVVGLLLGLTLVMLDVRDEERARAQIALAEVALQGLPETIPDTPDPQQDAFRAVRVQGVLLDHVDLLSVTDPVMGAGYRVRQTLDMGDRRIILDRGFIYEAWRDDALTATNVEMNGTLVWPAGLTALSEKLDAGPVMVIAATPTGDGIMPVPVDPAAFVPRHARPLWWFVLAGLWAGVTLVVLWRIKRRGEGSLTQ